MKFLQIQKLNLYHDRFSNVVFLQSIETEYELCLFAYMFIQTHIYFLEELCVSASSTVKQNIVSLKDLQCCRQVMQYYYDILKLEKTHVEPEIVTSISNRVCRAIEIVNREMADEFDDRQLAIVADEDFVRPNIFEFITMNTAYQQEHLVEYRKLLRLHEL